MLTPHRHTSAHPHSWLRSFGFVALLLAGLAMALTIAGCNSGDNETASSVKSSTSSLPESYPAEIPVYEPSRFERYLPLEGQRYIFNTADDISDVRKFYEQTFAQQGWTIEHVYDDGGGMVKLTVKYKADETFVLALIEADSGAGGSFYIHL